MFVLAEVDAMRDQLKQDRDGLLISRFCKPRLYSPEAAVSGGKYIPCITWFKLPDGACDMLHLLYKWKESVVFRRIWKTQLEHISRKSKNLSVEQIQQSIWQQSNNIWEEFRRGMVSTYDMFLTTLVKLKSSL